MNTETPQDANLYHLIGRMEGKMDSLLALTTKQDEKLERHGERIGKLERGRAYQLGVTAAASTLISGLLAYFKGH